MRKIILSLVVVAVVLPGFSYGEGHSELETGLDLFNACKALLEGPESVNNATLQAKLDWVSQSEFCYGYIRGMVEWNGYYEKWLENVPIKPIFCIGNNQVEINELIEIAMIYMNDHPDELNQKGLTVLSSAFSQAFPCSGN